MARKIALSELVRRIEKGEMTRKEFSRFFIIDKGAGEAFQPRMKLVRSAIDAKGLSATSEMAATALAHDAMKKIMASEGGAVTSADVLAEGDSWFDLPFFYSKTIVDQLNLNHFPVHEIATPGDTLGNMIASGDYARELRAKNYKVFMFSAGGNDVLGDLTTHIDQRESGDVDAKNAPRYIRPSFTVMLNDVAALYEAMIATVAKVRPRTKIMVHGYGYAVAQNNGPWLGSKFDFRGFHPVDHAGMCAAIVKAMVDAFNLRLQRMASAHRGRVVYVDFRSEMKRNDWWDELHPRPAAASRLADKVAAAISPYL